MEYAGNTNNIINWNKVIEEVEQTSPAYIGPRHKKGDKIIGMNNIWKDWESAGISYTGENQGVHLVDSVGWGMYFPGTHFSMSVQDEFAKKYKIEPKSCWISKLDPGKVAPRHWDANDNEETYSLYSDMERYHCYISDCAPGHCLMVDDSCIYNYNQGDVYKWKSRKSYHAGINCGFVPKYLFNIFGLPL